MKGHVKNYPDFVVTAYDDMERQDAVVTCYDDRGEIGYNDGDVIRLVVEVRFPEERTTRTFFTGTIHESHGYRWRDEAIRIAILGTESSYMQQEE